MNLNIKKNNLRDITLVGVFTGISTFVLTFFTVSYWQKDGFNFLEISLMAIIAGIYLFVVIIPTNAVFLNKSIRDCVRNKSTTINRIYQVLLSLVISMLLFLILDSIFFSIDNSVSKDFAESLKRISEKNGHSLSGIDEFGKLPFGIQNGITTFLFGLVGSVISLLFIKKDGQLFKSKKEWT